MKTTLLIDSSRIDTVDITLHSSGQTYRRSSSSRIKKAQAVLPLVDMLIKDAEIRISDIEEIQVADGDASYTGVRVGFAIANALGELLGVSVNGKKTLAIPSYTSYDAHKKV